MKFVVVKIIFASFISLNKWVFRKQVNYVKCFKLFIVEYKA